MTAPVSLTFRHLVRSGALESSAWEIGRRLKQLNTKMTSCHIELKGNGTASASDHTYQVKIHVSVPGAEIHAHSIDAQSLTPLNSAYENAKRQLEKHKRLSIASA
jgi:ribosome-associated translation inhibitor RaiA